MQFLEAKRTQHIGDARHVAMTGEMHGIAGKQAAIVLAAHALQDLLGTAVSQL